MVAGNQPLIVIVGPTGSGKSALALELASSYSGEIICADSRTVYKGMDIGTAKPSPSDLRQVAHHLLDLVEPGQRFTAAEFKRLAEAAIGDILARDKLPFLVGGTGLYVDAVIFNYQFSEQGAERDPRNPRHLQTGSSPDNHKEMRPNTLVIGIDPGKEVLKQRITARVEAMFEQGLKEEVRRLAQTYGWGNEAMTGVGYKEFKGYFAGDTSLEEVRASILKNTVDYAKRQRTWFKRNKSIQWLSDPRDAVEIVTTFLNN